jgi:hypothetical protein
MSDKNERWGGFVIEAIAGGGYIVLSSSRDQGSFNQPLFACSTKGELLRFISANLVNTNVTIAEIGRK